MFSDIDGTLYVDENVWHNDVKACHSFIKQGGIFSLATGRSDLEIINFASEELFPPPTFRISCNGAMIVAEDKTIFVDYFSKKALSFLADEIYNQILSFNVIELNTIDHIYFLMEPEAWVLNYKGDAYDIRQDSLKRLIQNDEKIMKIYLEASETFIHRLVKKIETKFADEFEIFNDKTAVNLGKKNVSKGTAIEILMKKYDIQPHEIAVIGDAANDISMFKVTPHSFTFHRAADFIKNEAQHEVETVAEAIIWINDYNKKLKN